MPASSSTQMKPTTSAAAARLGQALEAALVHDADVRVEARQAQRRAGAVDEGGEPPPSPDAA
jgi:hypothetical protein